MTDPYLAAVARSDALTLVREISASWRTISIERHAPLTTTLLRQRGRLEDELVELLRMRGISPFHTDLREQFLRRAMDHPDPLVAAVAAFERALTASGDGAGGTEVTVDWPVDPYAVLGALLRGQPLPDLPPAPHRTVVDPARPGGFRVEQS